MCSEPHCKSQAERLKPASRQPARSGVQLSTECWAASGARPAVREVGSAVAVNPFLRRRSQRSPPLL